MCYGKFKSVTAQVAKTRSSCLGKKHKSPSTEKSVQGLHLCLSFSPTIEFYLAMASGGSEASSLANTSVVARIAGTAVIATDRTKSAEQFRQTDPRQIDQMTTGTAIVVASRIARSASGIAWSASGIARSAIRNTAARIAVGDATQVRTETADQFPKRELRRTTGVNFSAGIAIRYDITRGAVCHVVTRSAQRGCEQVAQAPTQSGSRCAANRVTRIARDHFVTRVARNNRIAWIAIATEANAVD